MPVIPSEVEESTVESTLKAVISILKTIGNNIAIVISLIALVLSSLTYYKQYIWVKHDLVCIAALDQHVPLKQPNALDADIIFFNCGNQTEVLKGANLIYTEKFPVKNLIETGNKIAPLVLKPGEALSRNIQISLVGVKNTYNRGFHIGMHLFLIGEHGMTDKYIWFGKVFLDGKNGYLPKMIDSKLSPFYLNDDNNELNLGGSKF